VADELAGDSADGEMLSTEHKGQIAKTGLVDASGQQQSAGGGGSGQNKKVYLQFK
jgi:hypothetical protein